MCKIERYLVVAFLLLFTGSASAQIVGTQAFLQGQFLEIGMINNGAFGTSSSPTGYHAHPGFGTGLGEVYDYGHDGWTVGTPTHMGDYTLPGSPQEGWAIQVNGLYNNAYQGGGYPGTGSLTGALTTYSTVGGSAAANWAGTASSGGLSIQQETRVDATASWVVVTTTFQNTTSATINDVYYMRTCDPDNDESWGGSFNTINSIVYQNDAAHRVMCSAVAPAASYAFMGLATKDCRAKAFIIDCGGGLVPTTNLANIYNQTGGASGYRYAVGAQPTCPGYSQGGDVGFGLVYKIGNIAAGESAIISYAYVFNGNTGIDSAFPDPQIVINGVPSPVVAPPTPNYDTFNVCLYPGMTSLPVDILHATDRAWSWSTWTWSPAIGLTSSTGTHQVIATGALPASITYTITGTDSATGMNDCNHKVFYLTVFTCNGATVNSPCEGDTLKFNAPGDSTNATYVWFGPAPSTAVFSVAQSNYKFPAALSDSGRYTVIKSVGGIPVDTATCYATIHPLPNLTVSSSIALCAPIVNPVNLSVVPDSTCTDYSWTGPNGFTSTAQFPSIFGFDSTSAGTYFVQAISTYGCKNNGSVDIFPGVTPDFTFERHPGCPGDSVSFLNSTFNANVYSWNFGDGSIPDINRNPAQHVYMAGHNIYTVVLTASNAHCSATKSYPVDVRHGVTADFSATDTVCNQAAVVFTDLSTGSRYGSPLSPMFAHAWRYGDGATDATNGSATSHTYPAEGIYAATLVVTDSMQCLDSITRNIYVLQPYMHTVSDTTFCLTQPLALYNTEWIVPALNYSGYGFTYSWTPATYLSSDTAQVPMFNAVGAYTYTLTATLNHFNCPVSGTIALNSILPAQLQNVTVSTTIPYGTSIQLNADSELNYVWAPNDGTLSNPNISNPVATPPITTTYTVYGMDFYGCRDTATVTIIVDTTQTELVPTGFTPNGDGLNDKFHITGAKYQNLVEMRIFNRWGVCVFATNNKEEGWDGTYKGVPQDIGSYFYTVIVARPGYGDNVVYKGTVTLIR